MAKVFRSRAQHLKSTPATCGELLDSLERDFQGVSLIPADKRAQLRAGRAGDPNADEAMFLDTNFLIDLEKSWRLGEPGLRAPF